jgi:hypothetical protein
MSVIIEPFRPLQYLLLLCDVDKKRMYTEIFDYTFETHKFYALQF